MISGCQVWIKKQSPRESPSFKGMSKILRKFWTDSVLTIRGSSNLSSCLIKMRSWMVHKINSKPRGNLMKISLHYWISHPRKSKIWQNQLIGTLILNSLLLLSRTIKILALFTHHSLLAYSLPVKKLMDTPNR